MGQPHKVLRTVVAGRSKVIVEGLSNLINGFARFKVVTQCSNVDEILQSLTDPLPDVILAEIHLGGLDPAEAAAAVREHAGTTIPWLVISSHEDKNLLLKCMRGDVAGFVDTRINKETLEAALEAVTRGLTVVCNETRVVIRSALDHPYGNGRALWSDSLVSPREQQVLELMADGSSNREISNKLGISIRTVELHVSKLITKIGARSRTDAVIKTIRKGEV